MGPGSGSPESSHQRWPALSTATYRKLVVPDGAGNGTTAKRTHLTATLVERTARRKFHYSYSSVSSLVRGSDGVGEGGGAVALQGNVQRAARGPCKKLSGWPQLAGHRWVVQEGSDGGTPLDRKL